MEVDGKMIKDVGLLTESWLEDNNICYKND